MSLLLPAVLALLIGPRPGHAIFLSPAQKCQSAKFKTAGKQHFCRVKAMTKALKFGTEPDFSRCDPKFERKWILLEEKAIAKGVPCPSEGDVALVQTRLANEVTRLGAALAGVRFVDNGDGTISDTVTGLMWEQKSPGSGCLHCADDVSTWVDLADWLSTVNGHTDVPGAQIGLGGHTDWRIPTIGELQTLLLEPFPCSQSPCIDPVFEPVPAVQPLRYWSSTGSAATPTAVWFLDFGDGRADVGGKSGTGVHFRAVRGGL